MNICCWEYRGAGEKEDGLTAVVTALAAGTAKITVASEDGLSDSFDVIVLPAHAPDFGLALSEEDGSIALTWKYIPGVTEYRVMRVFEGKETCLAVTGSNAVILSAAQLPSTNTLASAQAAASRTTRPLVSKVEGKRKRSARQYQARI